MKRKIISILLLIIYLMSTIAISFINCVEAKSLDEWTDYFEDTYYNDITLEEGETVEYKDVDSYLREHYKNYESIDKNSITHINLWDLDEFIIKDFSDLEEFPNLKSLEIIMWEENSEVLNSLDLSNLKNLLALSIYGLDYSNLGIENLTNLEELILSQVEYNPNSKFILDLSEFHNLKSFAYSTYYGEYYEDSDMEDYEEQSENVFNDLKSKIIPIQGFELVAIYDDGYFLELYMYEKLNKGMQATDFEINFDASKLKLEDTTIDEDYYKLVEPGRILVSWVSFEEIDIQEIKFEFSAIGDGQAEIVILPENFADGNLDTDFIFAEAKQVITIEKSGYVKPNKDITTTIVDNKDTITGLNVTNNQLKIEDFLAEDNFADNLEVKVFNSSNEEIIDTSKGLGTGSKVKLYENGNVVKEYIVIVYGDTTGDGQIRANDALTLIKAANQIIPFQTETHKEAARVMSGSGKEPNARDALAIVKSANYSYTINQSK